MTPGFYKVTFVKTSKRSKRSDRRILIAMIIPLDAKGRPQIAWEDSEWRMRTDLTNDPIRIGRMVRIWDSPKVSYDAEVVSIVPMFDEDE